MGVIYKMLENDEKALEYYYKSIENNPQYWYSYLNISAIYIEQDKLNDAIDLLTSGINNKPDAHDLYYNRACCYSKIGNKKDAIKDMRKALVLLPSIIDYIKVDKDFENLHDDIEFIEMMKQVINNNSLEREIK